jgi:glyoxylase-like metal-dependent hydrolase (beta-lactamase superfamily II)/rhodanese-related sulfurtransferase
MENKNSIVNAETLRTWLEEDKPVFILDVRPREQREEWQIPGSHYLDAYKRLNQGDNSVLDEIEIPPNSKVITVCAAGRTSQIASEVLRNKGVDAYSLEDGMKAWSLAWNKADILFDSYKIIQLRRTGKGCLSYIIVSENEAIIIDASLPIEIYKNILQQNKWNLTAVMETHIHADHLSRSKQLADNKNVELYLPTPSKVLFEHIPIQKNQTFSLGKIILKVIATPGHTTESVSFLANNEVLFTGDTLFTNSIGRPDLKADNDEARRRTGLLYGSLQLLINMNDNIIVLPAHINTPVDFDNKPIMATIGEIKNKVPILKLDKSEFVETILAKLPPTPPNFLSIVEKNLKGDFSDINPVDLEAGANRCAIS